MREKNKTTDTVEGIYRMHEHDQKHKPQCHRDKPLLHPTHPVTQTGSWFTKICFLFTGLCALFWLILRTGTKPSRFGYPCQQSAFNIAAVAFGGPFVASIITARSHWFSFIRSSHGKMVAGLIVLMSIVLLANASYRTQTEVTIATPPSHHYPDIYFVKNARGIEPGRFGGVDDMVYLMGAYGKKFHRSETITRTTGPNGIISRDSVVILKVNGQWSQRGGTNTDVVRGVIRRIVEHPDGFVGEVIVADNGQGSGNLDRAEHNAEDRSQSFVDVTRDFATEGWKVSSFLWDTIGLTSVIEFDAGDHANGYVLNDVRDTVTQIRVSYPKFVTAYSTPISYKHGIWNSVTETYDHEKLAVINMPVLKTHVIYGVTASVKNHMGVIAQRLNTNSHNSVADGGMGSILSEIRMPDLNILDCIWILARPGLGPSASYYNTSFTNHLVASTDPVALDQWATKNILMPQIIANGYTENDYWNTQSPDNPDSTYRHYLDRSMNEMILEGVTTTNDDQNVRIRVWAGDDNNDGVINLLDHQGLYDCFTGPDQILDPTCETFDYNDDQKIDLRDWSFFQILFSQTS